jgi:hypothetical protein
LPDPPLDWIAPPELVTEPPVPGVEPPLPAFAVTAPPLEVPPLIETVPPVEPAEPPLAIAPELPPIPPVVFEGAPPVGVALPASSSLHWIVRANKKVAERSAAARFSWKRRKTLELFKVRGTLRQIGNSSTPTFVMPNK